jgi:hypothetical protein
VMELVPRPDLGCHQGDRRPAVDTKLHRVPNALRDVKEVLLQSRRPPRARRLRLELCFVRSKSKQGSARHGGAGERK